MTDLELTDADLLPADLMELIPTWQHVSLTKKGYNEQYVKTIIDVAVYILEREKTLLRKMQ